MSAEYDKHLQIQRAKLAEQAERYDIWVLKLFFPFLVGK